MAAANFTNDILAPAPFSRRERKTIQTFDQFFEKPDLEEDYIDDTILILPNDRKIVFSHKDKRHWFLTNIALSF